MDGVLNEHTVTVHKREADRPRLQTVCGVTRHLEDRQLAAVSIERAVAAHDASKCGRCFEDGGGY